MAYDHGRFVWFELLTPDIPKAAAFYGEIFDWQISAPDTDAGAGADADGYRTIRHNGSEIGGIVPPPATGLGPEWIGYFSVADVRRAAAKAESAGARPHSAPVDIPAVGQVAPMRDPDGANFCLFRGARGDPPRTEGPGAWFWAELLAQAPEAAAAFYAEALSLRPERGSRPGAHLLYTHGAPVAGVILQPPEVAAGWLPYVHVARLADVLSRGAELGGTFPLGELEGGAGSFAVMRDPFGAHVAVIEPL